MEQDIRRELVKLYWRGGMMEMSLNQICDQLNESLCIDNVRTHRHVIIDLLEDTVFELYD
jgi:hypothetical protein